MGANQSVSYIHAIAHSIDPVTQNPVFRNPESIKELVETMDPSITSIYELFYKSMKRLRDNKCLGTKKYKVDEDGIEGWYYDWKTFGQIYTDIQNLCNVIDNENLCSETEDEEFGIKMKVVGLCSINREEWIVTDLACNLMEITTVPLYETLGNQMLNLILSQTKMEVIFGSVKSLTNVLQQSDSDNRYLRKLVIFDEITERLKDMAEERKIEVVNYHESVSYQRAMGKNKQYKHNDIDPESIFTISYTSGTEKNPKGVMLTNKNFLSAITNILKVGEGFEVCQDDTYISYLPLAHVFDRLGVYSSLSTGANVGFFGGEILKIVDDLQILQPTVFPTVPRLLNKVYDRIQQSIGQQSYFKQWLFQKGIHSKLFYLNNQGTVQYKMYDKAIFSKAKARLGGRVRLIITASAPIAENVLNFLKCVLCCPIVEAYGQTESCGASFSTKLYDNEAGHVGGPCIGIEYTLADIPEMGYTKDSVPYPKGEVCIRGPSLFKGYFQNKELTDEVLDQNGWLHTGDVGMLGAGNRLKIVDRIKNIFKLSQGEYIVPEKLERVYEQSQLIAQMFIHGDSMKSNIVAIIYPEPTILKEFCQNHQLGSGSMKVMINHQEVKKAIEEDMMRLGKENKFNSLEMVKNNFRLVDQEFEVGTVLTPTQKLRRPKAREVFAAQINEMYMTSDREYNV